MISQLSPRSSSGSIMKAISAPSQSVRRKIAKNARMFHRSVSAYVSPWVS